MTTLNTFPKRGRRHSPQTRKREQLGTFTSDELTGADETYARVHSKH